MNAYTQLCLLAQESIMNAILNLPNNPKTCLELKLLEFYHGIFEEENLLVSRFVSLGDSLGSLRKAYYSQTINLKCSKINFVQPEMRCAYIFQYAACFSSTVAHHFQNMLSDNLLLLLSTCLINEVNICSLGGGPATDIVAIAKSLEAILKANGLNYGRPVNLVLTNIDIDAGWAETMKKIEERLVYLVDTSVVKCKLIFIQADLTKPLSVQVQGIIRKSDFVTMTKFVSAVYGMSGLEGVLSTMQAVVSHIQDGGILLLIDSSGFGHYSALQAAISSSGNMREIYGHGTISTYEMSGNFRIKSLLLFCGHYNLSTTPCYKSKNYVNAWQRKT